MENLETIINNVYALICILLFIIAVIIIHKTQKKMDTYTKDLKEKINEFKNTKS